MNPKKMNTILKTSILLLAVLVIGVLALADRQLKSLAVSTSKLKAEIEVSSKKIDTYELTKAKVDELAYVKDLAAKILPDTEEQSAVVAELSEFAKRSNLETGSISFVEQTGDSTDPAVAALKFKAPDGVVVVPVNFTVSGSASYEDVLSFLKYIEENRRKMQITEITLTPDKQDTTKLSDVSITLNLFVKDSKKESKK